MGSTHFPNTTLPPGSLIATAENLHEIVAMLRPDLCLMSRRAVDTALSKLVEAKFKSSQKLADLSPERSEEREESPSQ